MIQIYHNSRCGKSRNCLAFIEKSNLEFEIINYLVDSPSLETIQTIIKKLNIKPIELVRQKEKIWIDNFKGIELSENEIIAAMVDHPILIERPILVNENRAKIVRDSISFEEFFI